MTKQLMRPLAFPTLLPEDIFQDFRGFFDALDVYNPTTQTLSIRKGFPKGDIFLDKDGNRVIELALAGYSKEQLSVTVEDGKLTVAAKKCEGDEESRTLARRAFTQTFSNLGKDFNLEKAEVSYKDGLLRIIVPKEQEVAEIKELEIK